MAENTQLGGSGSRGKRKWVVHSHEATRPESSKSMSDINVTPMIDVLLVLLIIFMIVTPVAQKGLDIALPQASQQQQDQEQQTQSNQVVLAMETATDGTELISINKQPVASFDELERLLRETFQARADKTIFVRATEEIYYGRVVKAMDLARGAGVDRIGIISQKMIDEASGGEEEEFIEE